MVQLYSYLLAGLLASTAAAQDFAPEDFATQPDTAALNAAVQQLEAQDVALERKDPEIIAACDEIRAQLSGGSDVTRLRTIQFNRAISHWTKSARQVPTCVVQPETAEDVSIALQIIGDRRVPFAVQSGGHSSNVGHSSTPGVHISLSKLNEVTLSPDGSTARVGFGNRWLDVYEALEGSGRNVNGGRVPGPGVGGFTLGGGYTWKSNDLGLTHDTVRSFTLVLPNGTITTVDESKPDLFFALRGGLNKFGIVVNADFVTHEQVPIVTGGTRLYATRRVDDIVNATAEFERINTDPRALVLTSFIQLGATCQFFFDGPEPPASFAVFDNIPTLLLDTVKPQSFSSFVGSIPSNIREPTNHRGVWDTFSTTRNSRTFLQALSDEAAALSRIPRAPTFINYVVDAYIPGEFGRAAAPDTAFPHADSPLPVLIDVAWLSRLDDDFWRNEVRQSKLRLMEVARAEGILHPISYSNYARGDTPVEEMYGAANAARLAAIRAEIDPAGVMDLAGGFDI